MQNQCPQCEATLSEFAFECPNCGWTLVPDSSDTPLEAPIDQQRLEVDLHLEQAMAGIENQEYDAALLALNRAVADSPPERLAECHSLRGYVHLKRAEFAAAERDCSEAIERRWTDAQTFAWRAAARGEQHKWRLAFDDLAEACRMAGDQSDPFLQLMQSYSKSASDYFRNKIKNGVANAELFFDRGWVYLQAGKLDKARRDFTLALEQDSRHAWSALGMAKTIFDGKSLERTDLKKIIELCDIAVTGDLDCILRALKLRAMANHQFGRVAKSAKDVRLLRAKAGKDAGLIVVCGELRQKLGDQVGAISDYSAAIELDPDSHFAIQKRGDAYREIKNYPMAIEDYTHFIRLYPDDLNARVQRGKSLVAAGRLAEAIADFDRALKIDPACFDAHLGRSEVFIKHQKYDQALNECEKATQLDNTRPEAFAVLADIYVQLCDYGRAIEEYGRAIQRSESKEDQSRYLYQRGIAQYELSMFDLALDDLELAAMLRPAHSGSWIWKAAACARMEKWVDAITALEKAIATRPSVASHYMAMGKPVAKRAIEFFGHQQQRGTAPRPLFRETGLAHQFLGDHELAVENFSKAIEIEPNDYETMIRRGKSRAQSRDHRAAIEDFTYVIRREPDNHRARYYRAVSRAAIGKHDQALVDIIKAIKIAPKIPRYHLLHAELVQRQGKLDRAIKAYNRAIRIDSTDAQAYRRRGGIHYQAQDYLPAIHDFTRALELNPAMAEALMFRGLANLRVDRPEEAMQDFEMALTRNPNLARAYSGRASVLLDQGRHEYALIWLTKAIHRFQSPREISEILFARGKVFYQMRRFLPAIVDFSTVMDLMKHDPKTLIATHLARGIAWVQAENFDNARGDFEAVLRLQPMNMPASAALKWLDDRSRPQPEHFAVAEDLIRPTRPPVVGSAIEFTDNETKWKTQPPHDTWILRTTNRKEFGPVHKDTLDVWVSEGRVVSGMKVLRADWGKWKKAERVYPVLASKGIEIFPKIDVDGPKTDTGNSQSN